MFDEEDEELDNGIDVEGKKSIETMIPIMKCFDMDKQSNWNWVIFMRVFQAIYMTHYFVHLDEYYQVNNISYKLVYPNTPVTLPWEFNYDSQLRCFIYPIIQAIPMWIMKLLHIDTWWMVQNIHYLQ